MREQPLLCALVCGGRDECLSDGLDEQPICLDGSATERRVATVDSELRREEREAEGERISKRATAQVRQGRVWDCHASPVSQVHCS